MRQKPQQRVILTLPTTSESLRLAVLFATATLDAQVIEATSSPQPEQQVHNGSYTLNGNAASFSVPAEGHFPAFGFVGTLNGNELSYSDENATYRYAKR